MMNKWPLIALAALAASVATTNVQALTVNFASDQFAINPFGNVGDTVAVPSLSGVNTTAEPNGFDGFFKDDADGFVLLGAVGSDPNISSSQSTSDVQARSGQTITFSSGLISANRADIDFDFALQGVNVAENPSDILEGYLATPTDPFTPVVEIPGLNFDVDNSTDLVSGVSVVDRSIDISGVTAGQEYQLILGLDESNATLSNVAAGFDNISLTAIPEPATLGSSLGIAALMTGLLWVRRRGMRSV
jgi:hypothetical protein